MTLAQWAPCKCGDTVSWPKQMDKFFEDTLSGFFGDVKGNEKTNVKGNGKDKDSAQVNAKGKEKDNQLDREIQSAVSWYPPTDIYKTEDDYVFNVELPGLNKKDVTIEFENDTLSVKGERKKETEGEKDGYHWTERTNGKFYRAFRLPKNVDGKKINAEMKNGILQVRVPQPEQIKPRSISISAN